MKHVLTNNLFIALLACTSAFAAEQHSQGMKHDATQQMDHAAMKAMHRDDGQSVQLTDGIVKKVDQMDGKITLQHGEIANINMPAMTMSYRVKQAQWLQSTHSGDKVRFAIDKLNDGYIVTHIEVVR